MEGKQNPRHLKDFGKFPQVPLLLSRILHVAWEDAVPSGYTVPGRSGQSAPQSTLRLKDSDTGGGESGASESVSARGRGEGAGPPVGVQGVGGTEGSQPSRGAWDGGGECCNPRERLSFH